MRPHTPHIVFTEPYAPEVVARAQEIGRVTVLSDHAEATLCSAVVDADALLIRTATRITRRVLESAPRLQVIGRGGSGLDNIDLIAARQRDIVVVHTPDAATDAVADLAVGLMIALVRGLNTGDRAVRSGRFNEARKAQLGRELRTLSLGVIGMGRAGSAVARRCALGFGMTVLYNDIVDVGPFEFPAASLAKEELFRRADIVSLHVPLTDETRSLIDEAALEQFKPGAYLINTARGEVMDAQAVARALEKGRLAGAGIDVFDTEPPPLDHPLLTAPHTIVTPHLGARTAGAQERMNAVVEDVILVLQGKPPMHRAT